MNDGPDSNTDRVTTIFFLARSEFRVETFEISEVIGNLGERYETAYQSFSARSPAVFSIYVRVKLKPSRLTGE